MARGINTRPSLANKATGRIITVDPPNRIVEAGIRDGAVKVAITHIPPFFQWPQQGELWSIYKEGNTWKLGERMEENGMEAQPVSDMSAGEAKIGSDVIYTKTNRVALLGDIEVEAPQDIPLATGWSAVGTPYNDPVFYKDRDRVWLEGAIEYSSGGSSTVGTLPTGYRPAGTVILRVIVFGDTANLNIASTGVITSAFDAGSQNTTWLDGLSFRLA